MKASCVLIIIIFLLQRLSRKAIEARRKTYTAEIEEIESGNIAMVACNIGIFLSKKDIRKKKAFSV